jgi:hypothetical protein
MWELWWTKWHCDRFFSKFCFPLSILFHCGSPYPYILWRMKNRPTGDCSSETLSFPIDMPTDKYIQEILIPYLVPKPLHIPNPMLNRPATPLLSYVDPFHSMAMVY